MNYSKSKTLSLISVIIFVSMTVSLFFLTLLTPVHAENIILKDYSEPLLQVKPVQTLLENGSGVFLTTGDSWEFYQGYVLTVKSVNLDQKQAWITLENVYKNEIIKERILSEGDSFVYLKDDGAEILNITVDTIYISPEGELVAFKPVYQYLDYDLPGPVLSEEKVNTTQNTQNESTANIDNTGKTSGFTIFQTFAGTSILLVCRRVFEK